METIQEVPVPAFLKLAFSYIPNLTFAHSSNPIKPKVDYWGSEGLNLSTPCPTYSVGNYIVVFYPATINIVRELTVQSYLKHISPNTLLPIILLEAPPTPPTKEELEETPLHIWDTIYKNSHVPSSYPNLVIHGITGRSLGNMSLSLKALQDHLVSPEALTAPLDIDLLESSIVSRLNGQSGRTAIVEAYRVSYGQDLIAHRLKCSHSKYNDLSPFWVNVAIAPQSMYGLLEFEVASGDHPEAFSPITLPLQETLKAENRLINQDYSSYWATIHSMIDTNILTFRRLIKKRKESL